MLAEFRRRLNDAPSVRDAPPLFAAYLFLQVIAVAGVEPGEFPDTHSYFDLSFTGRAPRLPTVPLLYELFPTDRLAMWAQVLLAAVAWWMLASAASSLIGDRRLAAGLRVVVLMLGLAAPVVSWNSLLLSESVAISLTAMLIAVWIRYARGPRWQTAAVALVVTLFWTFTRQPHVLMCCLLAVVAVVAWARAAEARRVKAAVAVTLLLISVAGLVEINRNQSISRTNVGSMIQNRILLNKGWTRWFVAHGMPYSPSIAKYAGVPFHYRHENQEYFHWIDTEGTHTYLRFVLTHPRYTLIDPLPYFPGEQASLQHPNTSPFRALEPNPTPSLLSPVVNYGRHRNLLPSVVDRLLFDQGEIGDLLLLSAAAAGLFWVGRSRLGDRGVLIVPALVVASAVPQGYLVWLAGGEAVGELDRLSMVTAVSVRIGLWILVALAADRAVAARHTAAVRAPAPSTG